LARASGAAVQIAAIQLHALTYSWTRGMQLANTLPLTYLHRVYTIGFLESCRSLLKMSQFEKATFAAYCRFDQNSRVHEGSVNFAAIHHTVGVLLSNVFFDFLLKC